MTLTAFAQEYAGLLTSEQALFGDAVRRLLANGYLWREDDDERRFYNVLLRRQDLVKAYLQVAGWDLRHDERLTIFQVIHRDGMHRRHLTRETTIWLLLLRMIYAEQQEAAHLSRTRYPVTTVGEIARRYAEMIPGQSPRIKTSLDMALRLLQSLKVCRAANGGIARVKNTEQVIELLPTLEVIVPASEIVQLAERLRSYDRTTDTETDQDGGEPGEASGGQGTSNDQESSQ